MQSSNGGVKYNPLRKRTDSCDFDQYQLLLGTLLFTLIFFLFPTTAIYYFFFALFKSGIAVVLGLFSLLLHLLKSFPLFGIMVYIIDPNGPVPTLQSSLDSTITSGSGGGITTTPLTSSNTITTLLKQQPTTSLLSPKSNHFGHRRNQSLSSTTSSPIGGGAPRVSTQLQITYVYINIESIHLGDLFSNTTTLIQEVFSAHNPGKLVRSFMYGVPLSKLKN
eukprot:gene20356-24421_t